MGSPATSVVIPLKDEAENISALVEELEPVMRGEWELLLVDDGSTDRTAEVIVELQKERPYIRLIRLKENCGQSAALLAGFAAARAETIVTMDGDGQNDPRDIPVLLEKSRDYDLVCGVRRKRQDSFWKRTQSTLANAVRSRALGDGMEDTGCSLKVYRTKCLEKLPRFRGMHRFFPALFILEGFSVTTLLVNHRERRAGKTKYSLRNRSLNTVVDLLAVWWMRRRRVRYEVVDS